MLKTRVPRIYRNFITISLLAYIFLISACTPQWLFENKALDEAYYSQLPNRQPYLFEHNLEPEDKIILSIWGHDELGIGSTFSVFSSTIDKGKYLVIDNEGLIDLPLIGTTKLSGLTEREANLYLKQLYAKYLKDPIIYLRVLSHGFTIIGEVRNPGNYPIEKQRKNVVEAIGDASGFTNYADKSAVRIIRGVNNNKILEIPIDLTDMETLYTSSLLIQNDDIIYIPERRGKKFDQVGGRVIPFVSVIGGIAVLVSLISK